MRALLASILIILPLVSWARQPNVVVFLSDDQGWGDLSVSGNTNLSTPNIDSLAKDGASFDRFYVCPVCSPTRAEFLTGRYHQRGGVYSTSAGGERLDLDEITIGDVFRKAGYKTGAFGKWHNGMQYPYHPNGRGFDEFYGFCSGHWGNYFSPMLEHNGVIVEGDGFVIDDFTNRALRFIEKNKAEPFLVYLPYNTPHSPMQVPDQYWKRIKNRELTMHHRDPAKEDERHLRCALAMCENIDWNVGRVLKKLDELDLASDTIVLYFCDNGPNGSRWNGGMKGRKGSADEGGVRSPLLIRWPAKIAAGTEVQTLGAAIDLLPTLSELTGVSLHDENPLDGKSLAPVLRGEEPSNELKNRVVFSGWKNKSSSRFGKFRLGADGKLYDLESDPGQYSDISAQHPELHADLSKQLKRWKSQMDEELGTDTRPFVIAHPGHDWTQIPARDGIAHGGIERSSRHPNDSFFTHWTSKADYLSWEVEVAEAGLFEVQLFYTCSKANIGSKLELSFADGVLEGSVTEAVESELFGKREDRSPRTESYVQNWKPMTLGQIDLPKGKGTLKLKATNIPGEEVMDFRLMLLKRLE